MAFYFATDISERVSTRLRTSSPEPDREQVGILSRLPACCEQGQQHIQATLQARILSQNFWQISEQAMFLRPVVLSHEVEKGYRNVI